MKNNSPDIPVTIASSASFSKEEALSLILNNVEDSFLLIDRNLNVIATNEHTKVKIDDYFGIKLMPGMSILSIVPVHRQPSLKMVYEDVFQGAERTSIVNLTTKQGSRYMEVHFKPAKDEKGGIVGALVTTRDITETKKAEEELKEIEERWRFAIEGANQGVWDWNMQTNEIIYSSSYKKLYGFADDEMKNNISEWESRIHPEDQNKVNEALETHLKSNDPF